MILAIESSVPTARIAVMDNTARVLGQGAMTATRHSSNLLRLCDEALRAAGIGAKALEAIACGSGPGSFTGLRVGLAVAKGFALALDARLVLVPSLDALAYDLAQEFPAALFAPCLYAGKEQVYGALFRREEDARITPAGETSALDPAEFCERINRAARAGERIIVAGTGIDLYSSVFTEKFGAAALAFHFPGPSAISVGNLALARLARGESDDLNHAVPIYGRQPDITRPKKL